MTVVDGKTGTVVWEPLTLTDYTKLKASTTVTVTETATPVDDKAETVVAVIFAGGVAWWMACESLPPEAG